ncbi:polyadenylate-binding protein 2 [Clonorchis sinensis]|uniref:Polyadenylate-binding protein 2 n=1 Tax=Clonorchis sinensis TaxID=79923 RepID=H2KP15_CLOSI|nr:polyadenylate-binding protein 2 [Clonorchis sinensis]
MGDFVLDGDHEDQGDDFGDEASKEDISVSDDIQFDAELEAIKERFKEIEADANKLHDLRHLTDKSPVSKTSLSVLSDEDKAEVDLRSVYVGNVDYGATADELEAHFRACGPINRVTILCNKYTGQPKGFAYIEFDTRDAVEAAMALDESNFRNRALKVLPKRTNVPGMSMTNRPPYMRGGRGRGRGMPFGLRPAFYGGGRMRFPRSRCSIGVHQQQQPTTEQVSKLKFYCMPVCTPLKLPILLSYFSRLLQFFIHVSTCITSTLSLGELNVLVTRRLLRCIYTIHKKI